MTKLNIFWFGIVQGSLSVYGSTTVSQCCDHCLVLIRAAVAMETVTMEVTQPSTAGPVCPGQARGHADLYCNRQVAILGT